MQTNHLPEGRATVQKIIAIESIEGPYRGVLNNVMRMVPDQDKGDIELQRLLAFRLRIDGEGATREFLMRKIRDMIQSSHKGRLYDFLNNDHPDKRFSDR
jgi:hypothetical protein